MGKLNEIGLKYGTDKASNHHAYLDVYEHALCVYKGRTILLFELGVFNGSSLRMWSEYFEVATVVGFDIDPKCLDYEDPEKKVFVRLADQTDISEAFQAISDFGRPDIVVDDGSHRWDHQISSLQTFFPLLKPGGTYIIEDIDTSFDGYVKKMDYQGYSKISAFDYVVMLCRMLVGDVAAEEERPFDLFIANYFRSIESVQMMRRSCIIKKRVE